MKNIDRIGQSRPTTVIQSYLLIALLIGRLVISGAVDAIGTIVIPLFAAESS